MGMHPSPGRRIDKTDICILGKSEHGCQLGMQE